MQLFAPSKREDEGFTNVLDVLSLELVNASEDSLLHELEDVGRAESRD